MAPQDYSAMMLEAVSLMRGKVIDSSLEGCQCEVYGTSLFLSVLNSPAGSCIAGRMQLAPLVVEESGTQLLYAMYMNANLSESFGLPVWLGMDMDENRLLACFSVSTAELTADKLAEALLPLEEIAKLRLEC